MRTPLVEYGAYNYTWRKSDYNIFKLRTTEFTLVTGDPDGNIYAIFDLTEDTTLESGLSIA